MLFDQASPGQAPAYRRHSFATVPERKIGGGLQSLGMRCLTALFVGSTALVSVPAQPLAQTVWTGTTSSDWFTGTNWNPTVVPGIGDDVLINTQLPNNVIIQPAPSSGVSIQSNSLAIGNGAGSDGHMSVILPDTQSFVGISVAGVSDGGSGSIIIGANGGTGLFDILLPADVAQSSGGRVDGFFNVIVGDGAASQGTLNVLSGGKNRFLNPDSVGTAFVTAKGMVGRNGGTGTVTVDDAAWVIRFADANQTGPDGLHIGVGDGSTGTVNILSGGKIGYSADYPVVSSPPASPVGIVIGQAGGNGTLNVIGANAAAPSILNTGFGLTVGDGAGSVGNLNILSGGKAASYDTDLYASTGLTPLTEIGVAGGTGSILVSGAGSVLDVAGKGSPAGGLPDTATGDLYVGASGNGSLTIAEGGVVNVGTIAFSQRIDPDGHQNVVLEPGIANGILYLARDAGSIGSLNYGAAPGQAPAAVGTLNADGIVFGQGAGHVVFNHTDPNFQFDKPLSGTGALDVYAGTTAIATDHSVGFTHTRTNFDPNTFALDPVSEAFAAGFSGFTNMHGGTLILQNDFAIGSSTVHGIGNATLGYGIDGLSIANPITVDSGVTLSTLADASISATQTGLISGGGGIAKSGTGTLTLLAANTYTGGTTITAGTLQLGNGGTTGSIVGNVANNGTLVFNRSDLLPLGGVISGTGVVNQIGTGTTVLTGANSYAGPTTVAAGALFIDGNQSAATGATSVASGATLGGAGTIGGNVTVAGGATLSPGAIGVLPGTLAINGNLSLSGGSLLDYNLGQANVVGGPLNDLVAVGGDLILDGTLNVVTTPGGSFDTGIYRVISYSGSLTDNGLAIGTIPSPDYFVQTSVANQVNLVKTSGLTLNYWDGAAGPKNNGIVNGGDGLWQTSAGNDNWTIAAGTPNAPFSDGAFAIFTGLPGTAAVDNSLGAVTASGMQFAVDGYLITGDTLTLVAAPPASGISVIRVGDGTSAGSGYTATINAVLAGSSELVKVDLGTLVLNGANTYSGGTLIRGGTISISSDGNLGATAGGLSLDGGTLLTTADLASARVTTLAAGGGTIETAAATQFAHSGAISGPGSLTKSGAGILTLLADNSYSGGTTIAAGTLQLGNGGTAGAIVGDVTNNGTLTFNRSDTVTFAGAISGTGAVNQTGAGTTVLTADNSYAGGTTITAGTLQLGNGGTTGSIVGDVTDNGTLSFNRSDIMTFAGAVSGTGVVNQDGTGTTVLTSTANSYSGATNVNAGVLQAGAAAAFSVNSAVTVAAAGTLDLDGFSQDVAGITNAGLINMGTGTPPGTILTTPNYVGLGGTLAINTYLGTDGSPSDQLVIDGGVGSGTSSVLVNNAGGPGALTTGNGIVVIDSANGATTTAGAFTLGNPGGYVAAGPYAYTLFRSSIDGSGPQDWYLRSTLDCSLDLTSPACQTPDPDPPNYRPEVSTDVAVPELALRYGAALLDTLHERMGEERFFDRSATEDSNSFAWGRIIGVTGERDGSRSGIFGSEGPSYDYQIYALQSGVDLYQQENVDGSIDQAGLYAAFGRATADVDHFDGSFAGQAALNGVTLGGYWTHIGKEGWYLDAVAQGTWYDVRNGSSPAGHNLDTNGFGLAASLETGYPFRLDDEWVIEPQAQLVFQMISLDDANDGAATVRYSDIDSLTGRLGVRLARTVELQEDGGDKRFATTWLRASLVNEFLANPTTEFSSQAGYVPFHTDMKGLSAQLNLGFDVELERNLSLYGSVGSEISLDGDGQNFNGKLGLKVAF